MTKKITRKTLRKWNACESGYKRFCQLFPWGADLKTASNGLIEDGHIDWSNWLWLKCKQDGDYVDQTTVTAGDYGTAIAGYGSTAIVDFNGTATAGDYGTATTGDYGIAVAGFEGTATAGEGGIISIIFYDEIQQKYLRKIGAIGEGGLKPNVAYKLDEDGNFVEAEE